MKKIFTSIVFMAATVAAMATDFTDELSIMLNGEGPFVSTSTVSVCEVEGSDGEYDITLKQFSFSGLLIGDVTMKNVKGDSDSEGYTWFETEQDAEITGGDAIAQMLDGKVHVTIKEGSRMKDGRLYLVIALPVVLGPEMTFDVEAAFGTGGYQIPNSGFENFHKAHVSLDGNTAESDEPDAWHSFMSASGEPALVYLAGYNPHTFISEEVRPGSTGARSVMLKALDMWIAIANGTMTTGRINTGSMTAADVESNYSWNDMSKTDVDENGDPFYAVMDGKPDALAVWVKFTQGTPNEEHPYATISAVINDGTEYHDPEGSAVYNNVVAKAVDNRIETTGGEWKKLEIPFDYESFESNGAIGKAILVTMSTNADAGQGSDGDLLYVDDLSLIYNSKLETLRIKGSDIAGFDKNVMEYEITSADEISADDIEAVSDGRGAYIRKTVESMDGGVRATVTVISNDWKDTNVYTLDIKGATTGINKVVTPEANEGVVIYDISGRRLNNITAKGIHIIRNTDGTTVKTVRK